MPNIIGVKFKVSKTYYFDPLDIQFNEGDGVIVETSRGIEYGKVNIKNKTVEDSEINEELKPVIRKATDADTAKLNDIEERNKKAYTLSDKAILKHGLGMKLVNTEYTFDLSKLTIYFTADARVDFRDLVKELASIFHVRIELRQIYERDDIRQRGALAICGRPCCCITKHNDSEKVSIKMAKVQGLSLNPTKISGNCGKLFCCLAYENDYYSEIYKKMPKLGSTVGTPEGEGTACGHDMLNQRVKVKIVNNEGSLEYKSFDLESVKVRSTMNADTNDRDYQ